MFVGAHLGWLCTLLAGEKGWAGLQGALVSHERRLRAVLDAAADGIIATDAWGLIYCVNTAAARMFACRPDQLVGRNIDELLYCDSPPGAGHPLMAALAQHHAEVRMQARRSDNVVFPVVLSVGESEADGQHCYTAAIRAMSRQASMEEDFKRLNQKLEERVQERTALLKLLQKVAFAANLSDPIEDVLSYALMQICRHFKWAFACAYVADHANNTLTPLNAFYCEQCLESSNLQQNIVKQSLAVGTGLAGRVAASGKPLWSHDLNTLEDPALAGAAGMPGVNTAAGFPLLVENRVVAVLVFLLDRRLEPDARSADAMAAMGAQLGSFIERKQAEAQLRSSRERFHAIFQNAAIGIALVEIGYSGKFLRTNRTLNRMLGYESYELNHRSLVDILHADDLDRSFRLYHEFLGGLRSTLQVEVKMHGRDRQIVSCRLMGSLICSENCQPASTILLVEDISDRKRAEEDLRRISISLDHAREGIAHIDHEGHYLAANRAYAEILGTRQEELIGSLWESTLSATELEPARTALQLMRANGKADFWGKYTRDASVRHCHTVLYPAAGEPSEGHYCLVEDVTERKRLEKEITDVVLDRQRRIGQELQEGLIQQLYGMRMMARSLKQQLEQRGVPESGLASDFLTLVAEAQHQAKAVIKGLRPVEVDANGLMAALQDLAMATEDRFGVACLFQAEEDVPVEDNDTATQLFYIAKEAVAELVKQSPGAAIVIALGRQGGKLTMSISDASLRNPGRVPDSSDMSVRIMHYRAGIMGANLEICSAEGGGTAVVCTL